MRGAIYPIAFLAVLPLFGADPLSPLEIARRVADVEARSPWFWAPPVEGFADVPYVFEEQKTFRALDRAGKPIRPAITLHLERVALLGGAYYRCLEQNGVAPCPKQLLDVYERENQKAAQTDAGVIEAGAEERRNRRQAYWAEFPNAFRFEQDAPRQIRFTPTGTDRSDLLNIKGQLSFDPETFEITTMSYEVLADIALPDRKLSKGTRFSVELERVASQYLPMRLALRQKLPKGSNTQEEAIQYLKFRKFTADSTVRF